MIFGVGLGCSELCEDVKKFESLLVRGLDIIS